MLGVVYLTLTKQRKIMMKNKRFTESQIFALLKEGESGAFTGRNYFIHDSCRVFFSKCGMQHHI